MLRINKNIEALKPSATLAINQSVQQLRADKKEIVHFGFGQSPFPIHESIVKELCKHANNNHYLPTTGLRELKEEISKFLKNNQGITAKSEYIYIGPGSKELLYQTIVILDSIFLIPKGSWVSYSPQIASRGGEFSILETEFENNFKLSSDVLEAYCKKSPKQQKALILNSPNNPTGAVYTGEELESLANVCREYDIIVLSDEIYSQVNFSATSSPSISQYYPEKTIVFGGLSKVFSAGGYRLGFMSLPTGLESLHNTYRSFFSETFSAVSSPIQYAAIEAFRMNNGIRTQISDCSVLLKGISQYIFSKLSDVGIQCTQPQGAFYMMIGFTAFKSKFNTLGVFTSEQLSNYILEYSKVALLPASDFYFKEEDLFFRLAFVDFDGEEVLKASKESGVINECFIKEYCPNIYKGVKSIIELVS
ncbi:MAG: aminotransferase class I/II-fold pyridoxal phosphate-dependent enzyme [Cellulophaga sp.]